MRRHSTMGILIVKPPLLARARSAPALRRLVPPVALIALTLVLAAGPVAIHPVQAQGFVNTPVNWVSGPSMPTDRVIPGVSASGGKIYVTGGFNGTGPQGGSGKTLSTVEAFDIASGTWQTLPSLAQSTKGHGQVTTSDGRVWVVGGQLGDTDLTTVQVVKPGSNSWETKGPMQVGRVRHALALGANGKIYAIGGYVKRPDGVLQASSDVLEYDPVANSWTKKAEMLNISTGFGIAVAPSGKIWMTGGNSSSGVVEVYDPAKNERQTATNMPGGMRHDGGAAFGPDGRLYAAGGVNEQAILNTLEVGTIVENTPTPTRTPTPSVTPTPSQTPTVTPTYSPTPVGTAALNVFVPAVFRVSRSLGW